MIYPKMLFFCADFRGIRSKLHRRMTRAVVSREAYGVRGACSRCPMCGAVRQREQAPRTPYASRGLVPVMPAWGQTRPARPAFTEALPERDWRDWLALWHLFNYTV